MDLTVLTYKTKPFLSTFKPIIYWFLLFYYLCFILFLHITNYYRFFFLIFQKLYICFKNKSINFILILLIIIIIFK